MGKAASIKAWTGRAVRRTLRSLGVNGAPADLQARLGRLESQLDFLLNIAVGANVDLVDFDTYYCLMYKNDNLYERFTEQFRKGRDLREVTLALQSRGVPRHPCADLGCSEFQCLPDKFFLLARHYADNHIPFKVLDIGAHVGRFGLAMAAYLRSAGIAGKVVLYDAGTTAKLIPFNIAINGLQDIVSFEEVAVSDVDGAAVFHILPGYTDASGLKRLHADTFPKLVRTIAIRGLLQSFGPHANFIIKIDTEGFDSILIRSAKDLITASQTSLVFEFTPRLFADRDDAQQFLGELLDRFALVDVGTPVEPHKNRRFTAAMVPALVDEVSGHEFGYTDILAVPLHLPRADALLGLIARLR
jgi:FkbM family methyltransferase